MNENVNIYITPKGDKPVLHFSQFDNERVFTVTVLADDGETAAVLTGLDIEFRIRKTDSHVVTIAPESVADNVITFKTTEQLCACCGQNIASVVLMKDDLIIATRDIIVDIQRDILSGGLTSESDIRNLTTQIETIIPEVLADDYYTKTEVDELIDDIPTFDPTNYYDKSDVDGLLADKADVSDLPDMSNYYTKSETDTALSTKADAASTYNMTQVNNLLNLRIPKPQEQEVQGLPASVVTLSNAGENAPLPELTVAVTAVQEGSGTPSPSNPRPITGFSGANIVVADENMVTQSTTNIPFGQTVYGGVLDVTNGKLTITHKTVDLGSISWTYFANNIFFSESLTDRNKGNNNLLCSNYKTSDVTSWSSVEDMAIVGNTANKNIYIHDSNYTDAPTFTTAMSGVQLVYELATPTEITLTEKEIDTLLHDNNIYSDTGDILSMKYIIVGSEDVFKYIRMIKG